MIRIVPVIEIERPLDVGARRWGDFMREAHAEQGLFWHTNFLPRHFTRGAVAEYRYQLRTPGYLRRKRRLGSSGKVKYGGNVDLVYSGLLEQSVRQFVAVRGYPSRVTITMNGPRYVTLQPWQSNQPNKSDELTRVSPWEAQRLSEVLQQDAIRRLTSFRDRKTIRP